MESPDSSAVSLPSLRRRGNRILQALEEHNAIYEVCSEDGEGVPGFVKKNIQTLLIRIHLFLSSAKFLNEQPFDAESPSNRHIAEQIFDIAEIVRASIEPLHDLLAMPESKDDDDDFDGDDDHRGNADGPTPLPSPLRSRVKALHDVAV